MPASPLAVSHANAAVSSGSALPELASGSSFTSISQCGEVDETDAYTLGGRVRVGSGEAEVPEVFAMLQFHSVRLAFPE